MLQMKAHTFLVNYCFLSAVFHRSCSGVRRSHPIHVLLCSEGQESGKRRLFTNVGIFLLDQGRIAFNEQAKDAKTRSLITTQPLACFLSHRERVPVWYLRLPVLAFRMSLRKRKNLHLYKIFISCWRSWKMSISCGTSGENLSGAQHLHCRRAGVTSLCQ